MQQLYDSCCTDEQIDISLRRLGSENSDEKIIRILDSKMPTVHWYDFYFIIDAFLC